MFKDTFQELDNTANLISKAKAGIDRYIVAALEANGVQDLVPSHGDVMVSLLIEDHLTMSELASRVCKDPSTITTLVKKLQTRGYVRLLKDEKDRRTHRVSLTERGRALEKIFVDISKEMKVKMYEGISKDEVAQFKNILFSVVKNCANNMVNQ